MYWFSVMPWLSWFQNSFWNCQILSEVGNLSQYVCKLPSPPPPCNPSIILFKHCLILSNRFRKINILMGIMLETNTVQDLNILRRSWTLLFGIKKHKYSFFFNLAHFKINALFSSYILLPFYNYPLKSLQLLSTIGMS